jgi:hypothetical protein
MIFFALYLQLVFTNFGGGDGMAADLRNKKNSVAMLSSHGTMLSKF